MTIFLIVGLCLIGLIVLIILMYKFRSSKISEVEKSEIDEKILLESEHFRQLWGERLKDFPHLIPDATWESLWTLDYFCYFLRYRTDWETLEQEFIRGLSAHFAEFIFYCWKSLGKEIAVVDSSMGIACVAVIKPGIFRRKTYVLPVQQVITSILQEERDPFMAVGLQWMIASDNTNFLGSFALGACFGISPYGVGEWAEQAEEKFYEHVDLITPVLAQSVANYYQRVYGAGSAGADPDFYGYDLLVPPVGHSTENFGKRAAESILAYEKQQGQELSMDELMNLAQLPDDTISNGAIVLLLIRVTEENLPPLFVEMCFNRVSTLASGYRTAALAVASEAGIKLDWRKTRNRARFDLERRISLIPLINLEFEQCIAPANHDLIEALIRLDVPAALLEMENMRLATPELLFQKGMLYKVQQRFEEAEDCFQELRLRFPEYRNIEFFNEYGLNCLNKGNLSETINFLEMAVEGETYGRAFNNLAWAYICNGEMEKALLTLHRAIEDSDYRVAALLNRSYLYELLDDMEKSREDQRRAVRYYPFNRRCVLSVMREYFT